MAQNSKKKSSLAVKTKRPAKKVKTPAAKATQVAVKPAVTKVAAKTVAKLKAKKAAPLPVLPAPEAILRVTPRPQW